MVRVQLWLDIGVEGRPHEMGAAFVRDVGAEAVQVVGRGSLMQREGQGDVRVAGRGSGRHINSATQEWRPLGKGRRSCPWRSSLCC